MMSSSYTSTTLSPRDPSANHTASGNEFAHIHALVHDGQKSMDELDKEIETLVKRREEKSRLVKEHSALISPILRIPNEVLSLIFIASLPRNSPTRRRTILSKCHPAVVVSHVCHHWRWVSLNTPQLWTVIDVDVPIFPEPHQFMLEGGVDWWLGRLKVVYEMTTAWISRSGRHSLNVTFTGGSRIRSAGLLGKEDTSRANESVSRLVDALCNVSDRWKAAHLSLDMGHVHEASPPRQFLCLTFEDLIRLENISLDARDIFPLPELRSNLEIGRELFKAPNLRRLAIQRCWVSPMSLPVNWAALTELSFANPSPRVDPDFPFQILAACPNLTRCMLELPAPVSATHSPEPPQIEISLLHLHTLEIRGAEPSRLYASSLHLPSLRNLSLLSQPHYVYREFNSGAIDLIEKFGEGLTDVAFDPRGFTASSLTRVLSFLPNVVSFRLVEAVQDNFHFFHDPIVFDSALDELSRCDGGPGNSRSCPRLERFGWQMTRLSVFTQAALARFIASRRPGSHAHQQNPQTPDVAPLKSVVVAFSTQRFTKTVRDLLEEMGVDLRDMTLITTYVDGVVDTSVSATEVQMDDLYDNDDFALTVGRQRRTLDGWFL